MQPHRVGRPHLGECGDAAWDAGSMENEVVEEVVGAELQYHEKRLTS